MSRGEEDESLIIYLKDTRARRLAERAGAPAFFLSLLIAIIASLSGAGSVLVD